MKKVINGIIFLLLLLTLVACNGEIDDNPKPDEKVYEYNNDIYYSLFVRSFADSDGDGIGDLKGVTENLDYLEELGITGVWLLPIFESPSYHGYDITDYYTINSEYGTMADLQELLDEANERNIDIILDFVFNHTSDQHPWFSDQTKKDWYSGYQSFEGGMQDLNLNNDEVVAEIYSIAEFYLNMGVSGFRVDAVMHLFEESGVQLQHINNTLFMRRFNDYVKSIKADAFVVGEVYLNDYNILSSYLLSDHSYFNFYLQSELVSKIADGNSRNLLASNIVRNYQKYYQENPNYVDSPFLSNHDMNRAANLYRDEASLRQAISVLMTLPGNPFIYYGDELGMKGERYEGSVIAGRTVYDEYRRQPFIWGDERVTTWLVSDGSNDNTMSYLDQKEDSDSLFNFTKTMIALRKDNPALMEGLEIYRYDSLAPAQSYIRVIDDGRFQQALLVVHNLRNESLTVNLDLEVIYGSKIIPGKAMAIFEIPFNRLEDFK